MKTRFVLGIVSLCFITIGTYIYYNRYTLFKYLPNVENTENFQNLNGKLYDENGKPFTGRKKETNNEYTDIYSYKDGELDGLNVMYYKNNIKEIGH